MAHECAEMKRSREVQTLTGQMAYGLYKHWLEKQRRKPPAIDGFITSAYYSSFIKFADWCRETSIADPQKYVELMLGEGIAPALWRRSEAYAVFLDWFDKKSDPIEQAEVSINTLFAEAERRGVPVSSVFTAMHLGEVLQLLQQRKLSPWVLFCSDAFKAWLKTQGASEQAAFVQAVNPSFWAMKFEQRPDVVRNMRELSRDLGI